MTFGGSFEGGKEGGEGRGREKTSRDRRRGTVRLVIEYRRAGCMHPPPVVTRKKTSELNAWPQGSPTQNYKFGPHKQRELDAEAGRAWQPLLLRSSKPPNLPSSSSTNEPVNS